MVYPTGTLSIAKLMVNEIKSRMNDIPIIDFGFVKVININSSSLSVDYTVSVYLPDRDLLIASVPVMSNMVGSGFGNFFLPKITTPQIGQRCIVAFMNKQLEDPVVLGFVGNVYPTPDELAGKNGSAPSDIEPNEWILRHKALGGTYDGTFAEVRIDKDNIIQLRQLNSSQVETAYVKILPTGEIQISGASVIVNSGANGAARIGDAVSVSVPSHGTCTGTITGGSTTVKIG